ncbi:MAG: serine hydrolase [Pirellulaceae bacterium]
MFSADPFVLDPDSAGWASVRNYTSAQFAADFDARKDTQILVDIEVDEVNGQQRVSGVWQQNLDNRGWAEYRNLTSAEFSDRWQQLRDDGYRLIDQESYVLNNNRYYAGIWIENRENYAWASLRNLTSAEFSERFAEYKDDYVMVDVEAYTVGNSTRYAMAWVENVDKIGWAEYRNMTSAEFGDKFDELKDNYRMTDIESYQINGQQNYAGIWVENTNDRGWFEYRDMTSNDFSNRWNRLRDLGFRLIDTETYETNNGTRYAGIWRQNNDRHDWSLRSAVDQIAQNEMDAFNVPGMSVAIAQGGEIKYMRGFGDQNVANNVWYNSNTVNRLASVSKAIAGVLTMDLVEDGLLELNDLTRSHVPELPAFHSHTIEDLVSNRSGITPYNSAAFSSPSNTQFDNALDATDFFIDEPLLFSPGTGYNYSTHGYTVLGAAMEAATNQTVFDLFDSRITDLGYNSLRPEDRSVPNGNRSQLYSTSNNVLAADNISWKVLGGGLEASAQDLVRFGMDLLDGEIISQQSMNTMWTAPDGASNYALGWNTGTEQGTQVVAKNGAQAGANTYIRMYPEHDIVIVVLSNRQGGGHDTGDMGRAIGSLMLNNLLPVRGDFNGDRKVNAADIDLLCSAINSPRADVNKFNLNRDRVVDANDMDVLVHDILRTRYGDANLDGVVDSSDLVQIFRAGEYEDRAVGNSTWAEGDFDCDGEFTTSDLVKLFADGGYVG